MIRKIFLAVITLAMFAACSSDDDNSIATSTLTLNFTGLEDLGPNSVYEGWIIVDGSPVSTGVFTSVTFPQTFPIATSQLNAATKFVLSIEPVNDTDPAPSAIKILAGDFLGTSASVDTGIIADFSNINGQYILTTPSTNSSTDNNKGVWFLDPTGAPDPTLTLPTLPTGWKYEGWAIINGTPISSGRFDAASGADADGNPFAGTDNTMLPPFPGEDFIMGNPNGVDLAMATHIAKIVVSIEPEPDNSVNPFLLKPLVGEDLTENAATAPTLHNLSGSLPFGTVTR